MNKVHLRQHGLDIEKEARVTYVNSQDSAVMNVFLGLTKAGGTWPPTWIKIKREKPEVGRALKVLTQTDPLPNLAIVVRTDVPEGHAREVARNLFNMGKTQQGESILKSLETPGFETADSRTYAPVRRFLEMYERLFGSLPQPSRQQAAGIQAPSVSR
jgi:phosphonate transport system substrate-binding protein